MVKLVLFFSVSFVILTLVSAGLRFLVIRLDWMKALPRQPEAVLTELVTAARWALSLGMYGSMLIGLSYAARRDINSLLTVFFTGLLSLVLVFAMGRILDNWENVPSAEFAAPPLGGSGLIVANNSMLEGTAVILLRGESDPEGPRVVAVPGQPLSYRAEFPGRDVIALPPAPFGDECPWFLKSLAIDLKLSAENLRRYFHFGPLHFLGYVGALLVLLTSCMFIFRLSAWHLANLFLGALVFRGILALEVFFNSPEMQDVFSSFLQDRLPVTAVVPFIFFAVGILANLYTVLVFLARRRDDHAD